MIISNSNFYFRTPFRWMQKLPFQEVQHIQNSCSNALNLWGYNIANNEEEYKILKPLRVFKLNNDESNKSTMWYFINWKYFIFYTKIWISCWQNKTIFIFHIKIYIWYKLLSGFFIFWSFKSIVNKWNFHRHHSTIFLFLFFFQLKGKYYHSTRKIKLMDNAH